MLLDEKTRSRIQLKIRNGCGQGEGKDYKPWIRVGEFSSSGTSYRIPYYNKVAVAESRFSRDLGFVISA